MEGQLGILVGGRTELALFTAINSLPLTAYRFLLPKSLASSSSSHTRTVFVLLSVVRFYCCGYSKQSRCFLSQARTTPQERGPWLAEIALSRKWWESMRSACLSASRNARTHTRAHTLNLTGRFARGNLKCKTETRADADSVGAVCRVGFSVVATSPCALLSAVVSVWRVNTFWFHRGCHNWWEVDWYSVQKVPVYRAVVW